MSLVPSVIIKSSMASGLANELLVCLPFFFYRITVTFNVNNSIPPNFEEEVDQGQQKSPEEEVSRGFKMHLTCKQS